VFLQLFLFGFIQLYHLILIVVFLDSLLKKYPNVRSLSSFSLDLLLSFYLNYLEELFLHFLLRRLHYRYFPHQVFLFLIIAIPPPRLIFLNIFNFLMPFFSIFTCFLVYKLVNFYLKFIQICFNQIAILN